MKIHIHTSIHELKKIVYDVINVNVFPPQINVQQKKKKKRRSTLYYSDVILLYMIDLFYHKTMLWSKDEG